MEHYRFSLEIELAGPVLTGSSSTGRPGIDAPFARDHCGRCYLPFSLVKGRFRQSAEELNEALAANGTGTFIDLQDVLGEASPARDEPELDNVRSDEPRRGRISFTDFVDVSSPAINDQALRFRIRIDPARGAVDEGALQMIEVPYANGSRVSFRGDVGIWAEDEADAAQLFDKIVVGLRWSTHFGALGTLGFGRTVGVRKQDKPPKSTPISTWPAIATRPVGDRWVIGLRIDRPFCVSKRRIADNLFESSQVISGGVLRGCLASQLLRRAGLPMAASIDEKMPEPWTILGKYFDRITFCHAYPVAEDVTRPHKLPVVIPHSFVMLGGKSKSSSWLDVATYRSPRLFEGKAPVFGIDWKERSKVDAYFGWSRLSTETRVRTRIDRATRRASDEQLFAYEMVRPTGFVWLGHVDLQRVPEPDRAQVGDILDRLLGDGLVGIGKTKATADVSIQKDVTMERIVAEDAPLALAGNPSAATCWCITLQTPALLCNPRQLAGNACPQPLFDEYRDYWDAASDGKLKLQHFFASQSLAGGYLSVRYQSRKPYNPFLLTDAGSVFVLESSADSIDVEGSIEHWRRHGLPLPKWVHDLYGDSAEPQWRWCPFRPEDGFGAVAVNLTCHHNDHPTRFV